jgi:hypothetical protein
VKCINSRPEISSCHSREYLSSAPMFGHPGDLPVSKAQILIPPRKTFLFICEAGPHKSIQKTSREKL